jgi:adenylosuccinate synthase
LDLKVFKKKLTDILDEKNHYLKNYLLSEPVDLDSIIDKYSAYAKKLTPYISNISVEIDRYIKQGKHILFEGAQGTHLDIDHGTYPFVTSSNTVAGNACSGSGTGPKVIDGVIGIVKAYTTRVGEGPFPTELFDDTGAFIQKKGAEFGATTGRQRRCGWMDMVILRNAVRLNSLTGLVITKLDVLSGLENINICTAYDCEGKILNDFPSSFETLAKCKPIYETLPGWHEDISKARHISQLPENAKKYIQRIQDLSETPVDIISVGPGREETITLNNPFIIN